MGIWAVLLAAMAFTLAIFAEAGKERKADLEVSSIVITG